MPVLVLYPDAKEIPMEDKKLFLIGEVAKMFHIVWGLSATMSRLVF